MARTPGSIQREHEYKAQIPAAERRLGRSRLVRAGGGVVAISAIIDAFSTASITNFYNNHVLNSIDIHIPTGRLVESRLAVAGLYATASIIGAVRQNGNQNHVDHLEAMAASEAHFDRLATAIELSTGQLPPDVAASTVSHRSPSSEA